MFRATSSRCFKWPVAEVLAPATALGFTAAIAAIKYTTPIPGIAPLVVPAAFMQRHIAGGPRCKYTAEQCNMQGKTVIVTGANTGVGLQTAFDLAKARANVVLLCRRFHKAKEAADKIHENFPQANLIQLGYDFESVKEMTQCVEDIEGKLASGEIGSLDCLINNAGVLLPSSRLTGEGIEAQIAVNHLAPFLLTEKLLPHLWKNNGRIINVNSRLHAYPLHIDWKDETPIFSRVQQLDNPKYKKENFYGGVLKKDSKAYKEGSMEYPLSKALNIIHTMDIARRLSSLQEKTRSAQQANTTSSHPTTSSLGQGQGLDTKIVSLHPGAVMSDMYRHLGWAEPAMRLVAPFFLKTPKEGARTTLDCCYAPPSELEQGGFYVDCALRNEDRLDKLFQNERDVEAVLAWSREKTGLSEGFRPFC